MTTSACGGSACIAGVSRDCGHGMFQLEGGATRSQTEIENFFWTFLTVFYRFRSYSVTLLPSFESPFPPVPRVSVVIHVVKNASRQKKTGSVFYVQSVCIVTPGRGLCKWFLRGRQFKDCGAIDKEYNHLVYTLSTW